MAATHVHSVEWSALQTVSWSQDDRIAVSADKEIIILVTRVQHTHTHTHTRTHARTHTPDQNKTTAPPDQLLTTEGIWH